MPISKRRRSPTWKITYQPHPDEPTKRKPTVTIASERADITITGFPYRIWLETGKIYIEKTTLTRKSIFHNEKEVGMDKSACEIAWEEGDSFYFPQGSITVYQDDLVVEMPEEKKQYTNTTA